ncbi:scruin like at the midline [Lycorma delicatula]|uniref:scruin like at the midline n=1 Tax=Lycorma delicatula TaxID=130591 RepID=UPI003F51085D
MENSEKDVKYNSNCYFSKGFTFPKVIYSFKPYKFVKCLPVTSRSNNNGQQIPIPRSGHRIACDNVNLYSYGGFNPKVSPGDRRTENDEDWDNYKPLFREVWKLNLASRIWTKLSCAHIPDVLASNAVTLAGNVLMVFGGTGVPFGAHCSNDLYLCDLSKQNNLSFTFVKASGDVPSPRYGQAIVFHNKYLYTVGGTTGYEYSLDIHCLDLQSKVWEQIYVCNTGCEEPPGRYRHELAFDGNRIFVLGGGTAEVAYGFEVIPSFNLMIRGWESIKTVPDSEHKYPLARRCHSCVQFSDIDDKLYAYIIGGYNKYMVFKDVWRLDLTTFQWNKLCDSYPYPIYFHTSAITPNGKVYTFGGNANFNPSDSVSCRTADVYAMWVTIPKLKEICWEALLFYSNNLHMYSDSFLFNSGIPSEFIQRINNSR